MQQLNEQQNFNPLLLKEVVAAWAIVPKDKQFKINLHAALMEIEATEQERKDIFFHVQSLLLNDSTNIPS